MFICIRIILNKQKNKSVVNINENNKMRVGGGIFTYVNTDFELVNYQSHPSIKAPLSN